MKVIRRHLKTSALMLVTFIFSVSVINNISIKMQLLDKSKPNISLHLPQRQLWKSDNQCSNFSVGFLEPKSGQRCALASYPGSGSTWLRYLIEGATGIFTGSQYKDLQLQMKGYWGEIRNWKDGSTIVQKTHDFSSDLINNGFHRRGILILRNPYDAVISKLNYLYAGHHGRASSDFIRRLGSDWEKFVEIEINDWLQTALSWILNASSLHIVHYEDMKKDLRGELLRILAFLKIDPDIQRLECLLKHANGMFKRKPGSKNSKFVFFTQSQRHKIDNIILHLNRISLNHGLGGLPLNLYESISKAEENQTETKDLIAETDSRALDENTDEDLDTTIGGAKLILAQYIKYIANDNKSQNVENVLDSLDKLQVGSDSFLPGMLSRIVKAWPNIERGNKNDPVHEIVNFKHSSKSLSEIEESLIAL